MFEIKLKKKQQQKLKFVIYWLYNLLNLYRKHIEISLFMFFVCDVARKNMCDRHRPHIR